MKLLSWNILSGGFNSYTDTSSRPQRLDGLINAIHKTDADFVSLIDTYRWTEIFPGDELKQLFDYPDTYSTKLDDKRLIEKGHDNGITIFTNLSNCSFQTIRLTTRNTIKSSIETGGHKLDIFSVYLDDISEDTRLQQIKELFGLIDNSVPTIFLGDFNTIDEGDLLSTSAHLEKLKTQYPVFINDIEIPLKEMMKGQVTKYIKAQGFNDLGKISGNTVPAKLFPIKTSKPIVRLDYAFGSNHVEIKSFRVLTHEPFASLSDHYPILIEI